jgi:hypothetical protein
MKKKQGLFGFAVLVLAAIFPGGCDTGAGGGTAVTYSGTAGGKTYTLVVYEGGGRAAYTPRSGDRYELTINPGNSRSTGTVKASAGTTLTLEPANASASFTVTTGSAEGNGGSGRITAITGTITLDNGTTVPGSAFKPSGGGGGGGGGGGSGGGGSKTGIDTGDQAPDNGFTVNPGGDEDDISDFSFPLPSVKVAKAYLAHLAQAGDPRGGADNPVLLPMKMDLGSSADSLTKLLEVTAAAGKYVDLDLALCSMAGTEFDPDNTVSTGKNLVVSLILPDAAESIKAGGEYFDTSAFNNFTSLKRVSGNGIETIGAIAFAGRSSLTTADFPAATEIDSHAFYGCGVTTVNLPAAANIGEWAFTGCRSLTTADFPVATYIGEAAFHNCDALTTVNLPKATYIGDEAFGACDALTTVDLPAAVFIGQQVFYACPALTTLNLPSATHLTMQAIELCPALTTLNLPKATDIGSYAFGHCSALTTLDLPSATHIDYGAFLRCEALTTLNLPAITSIGNLAFSLTGTQALTITLPQAAPAVENDNSVSQYFTEPYAKTVTIKRPLDSAGYDTTWADTFKGLFGNDADITLQFEDL